jgi:hypothetical protein
MDHTAATLRRSLLLASCAGLAAYATPSLADTRVEVRVSGGIGVENNPFLVEQDDGSEDEDGAAFAAEVMVEPSLFIEDERTTFRLYGNARLRQFFDGYDTTGSLTLGAEGNTRIDERTSLSSGARFTTSRDAAQEALLFDGQDLNGLDPGVLPSLSNIDPTIAGFGGRFTSYGANVSVNRQFTPQDSGSVSLAFEESRVAGNLGLDTRTADLILGYGRRLSERTSFIANLGVSKADLVGQNAGDAVTFTPTIGIQQQVSERLNWSGQVGLSHSRIDDGLGDEITDTTFALSLNGCRRDLRGALCVTAQRQPRATAFGGLSNTTAVTIGYDATISRRDSIGVNVNYRKSSRIMAQPLLDIPVSDEDELIGVAGNFRRAFTDRLSGFVSASYAKINSELFPDRDANIAAYIGLSYYFGRLR